MRRRSATERMREADRLVSVRVAMRVGTVELLDDIAALRGWTRSEAVENAAGTLIARETVWLERSRLAELARAEAERAYELVLARKHAEHEQREEVRRSFERFRGGATGRS